MKSEYRRNGRVIVRRGLALSLGLWLALMIGALPQPALAAFDGTPASTISVFYAAAFDRTPVPDLSLPDFGDLGGLAFWTNAYLAGEGDLAQYRFDEEENPDAIYTIADFFVESEEFQARYPARLTNEEYVTALYNNLLGRPPEQAGLDNWVDQLQGGTSRGTVLADFTFTDEAKEFNPTQQEAMQSFIVLLAANEGVVMPEQAAEWLVENPTLDAAAVDSPDVPVLTLEQALDAAPVGPYQINANAPKNADADAVAGAQAMYPQVEAILEGAQNAAAFTGENAAVVFVWAIADTAANILAAAEAEDPAVTEAASVGLTAAATVAELADLAALANFDGVYALADTLENLAAAAEGVVAGATKYELTDPAGDLGILSAEQIALVKGATNTEDYTWQTQVVQPSSPTFALPSSPNDIPPQPITITITTTTAGATIRFATVDNETNPLTCTTGTFLENRGQVMVDRPLTLHAIACLNGQASVPATATYEIKITNRVTFNDTGIDQCAENDRYEIPCPITRFPGQDAEYGRDAWARGDFAGNPPRNPPRNPPHSTGLAKIGGGAVGFDFTRMCGDGRDEGQDGCLENLDFNPNNPSLRTGDGPDDWACTRDNVTSLIWEIKTDAADIPSRELRDKNWTYTWYNPNSATNGSNPGVRTGGICRLSGTQQPSCDTQGYLAAINDMIINGKKLCGGADWRLPTSNELNQLMHYGRIQPSMDEAYFPTVVPGIKWTSETLAADSSLAWIVASSNGAVEPTFKGNPFGRILAVSGPKQATGNSNHCQNGFSSTVSGEFEDHGNGTVTHETTQLMWARCALGRTWNGGSCTGPAKHYNWENALQELKRLNNSREYANYSDWRIPNIKELNSIVEHCRTNPAINTTVFPDMSPTMTDFWSSSPLTTVQSSAWYVDFRFGRVDWTGKSNAYQVLLVRDAYNRDAYN